MYGDLAFSDNADIGAKLTQVNWGLVALICAVAGIGFVALYSAANGAFQPWAGQQMLRFSLGMIGMLVVALVDIRIWMRLSYLFYAIGFVLLVGVEIAGQMGMGAQRWINLGVMNLQPSEVMKIAVIMALARYFQARTTEDMARFRVLMPAVLIVLAPAGLVLLQPDLGTSAMLMISGGAVFFIAGMPLWMFGVIIATGLASLPVAWQFLEAYQKERIMTFLNPERDPLGAGYHITQSKIALGSGGVEGKGFLQGTQSHLNFLPEKQTDFIFTLWAEEWGLVGGLLLLVLFGLIFLYGIWIAGKCRHAYGKLLAMGITVNFSLYVFINVAMVMGLIPVVGAPLPLVSYGGTAMLAALSGFGLLISCYIHRDAKLTRM